MSAQSRLTGKWAKTRRSLDKAAHTSRNALRQTLLREAAKLSSDMKENIVQGGNLTGQSFTPNAAKTVAKKKSSKPLIDHGDLLNAIGSHKLGSEKVLVGIPGDKQTKKKKVSALIAAYARLNEYGGVQTTGKTSVWIPPRPFVRTVYEHTRKTRHKEWEKALEAVFQG